MSMLNILALRQPLFMANTHNITTNQSVSKQHQYTQYNHTAVAGHRPTIAYVTFCQIIFSPPPPHTHTYFKTADPTYRISDSILSGPAMEQIETLKGRRGTQNIRHFVVWCATSVFEQDTNKTIFKRSSRFRPHLLPSVQTFVADPKTHPENPR